MKYAWLRARRWYRSRRPLDEPMRTLLGTQLPAASTPFTASEFLVLDVETTGLDAATAEMLSVGWVIVRDGRVILSTAQARLVRPDAGVGDSATVHGLTDMVVNAGADWSVVLDEVLAALVGRVLVVHHAGLDKALLDRLCLQRFGVPLLVPVVDTLALELRRAERRHHLRHEASLRLPDIRAHYGLPRYAAHDSLVDAIATAELLVAMAAHGRTLALADFLT